MDIFKQSFRAVVDDRLRDSIWAWRSRGDKTVLAAVARGWLDWRYPEGSNRDHLQAGMDWLCAAQGVSQEGGVSAFYDIRAGEWGPLYPETTGYILPTFFDYAEYSSDENYRRRALCMAEWLLTLQLEDGSFPIGPLWPEWERKPIVFDTGQILHGLVRAYEEVQGEVYRHSAIRAGDWLVAILDEDGCWRKFTSQGTIHTYNVRTAWALLRLFQITQERIYQEAAERNLNWALTQQDADGWFHNAGFSPDEDPLTHTIAYTIRGLLESGLLLSNQKYVDAARLAAAALAKKQSEDGYLKGRYGPEWRTPVTWSCLTGDVQMAIIWMRCYELTGEARFWEAARIANSYVKRCQPRNTRYPGVSGGVAGSFPIYGDYEPYRNLNWAVKFLVESLMLEERLLSEGHPR